MNARPDLELKILRASGIPWVAVRAPDGSPLECLAADETVYSIERALREAPLPHAPGCTCFYAPRWSEDGALPPDTREAA